MSFILLIYNTTGMRSIKLGENFDTQSLLRLQGILHAYERLILNTY
jgi:hypothetical protein